MGSNRAMFLRRACSFNIVYFIVYLSNSFHLYETSNPWTPKDVDFIVVGAGAAGAPVAARLAEIPEFEVALLEAGKKPPQFNLIPYFSAGPHGGEYDWNFITEEQETGCLGFKNRQWPWPRGKGLGGSTIINGMAFIRGHKKDYDHWEKLGNSGWGYENVLPYFIKLEDYEGPIIDEDDRKYHGKNGPVGVSAPTYENIRPLTQAFFKAGKKLGYKVVDYNAKSMTGFSHAVFNVKNGTRCNTYTAYLKPNKNKKNFHIIEEAFVTKVIFKDNTATGVIFENNGKQWQINARKDVILSAGSVQSPQLLMLSGIGPEGTLKKFKIPVVKHVPGVGQNLVDHAALAGLVFTIDAKVGFTRNSDVTAETMEQWELHRKGPLTVPLRALGIAFMHSKFSKPEDDYPDFELQFFQSAANKVGLEDHIYEKAFGYKDDREMLLIHPVILRSKSVGYISLKSADPHVPPLIQPKYLEDSYDVDLLKEAIKASIKLMETEPFKALGVKWHNRTLPGCESYEQFSEEHLECFVRHYSYGIYHQSGTCKMGLSSDPTAVVDDHLRVHGIKNLRVIDVSICPTLLSAHTMAPAMMIGEKGAAIIIEDWMKRHEEL